MNQHDNSEAMSQLPPKLATLIQCLPQAPFRDHLAAECIKLTERIAELEAEVLEQARCNGMGAERELALMAERDTLREEVERLRPNAERWEWIADGNNFDESFALLTDPKLTTYELTRAVDAAIEWPIQKDEPEDN